MPLIHTAHFQDVDINILTRINLHRNRAWDSFFRTITNSAGIVAILLPVLLLCIGRIGKGTGIWEGGIYGAWAYIIAVVTDTSLKYILNKPRPFITYPFIEKAGAGGSPSFPSGHTTDAFVTAGVLSIICQRWYITLGIYTWALLVAYSRVDLGVHYPSDVLGGSALGTMAAFICCSIKTKIDIKAIFSGIVIQKPTT
jgi:undecaprenyl-diphosphatase